ncbi:hypothetical protein EIP86_011397 [Pleurotus ostreatoroseus]|nr:hypothetical protein EIP86_011397 [Pleurotus ostreatoroseus]
MDALFAKADAIRPAPKRRKTEKHTSKPAPKAAPTSNDDRTLASIAPHTALPKSLRTPPSSSAPSSSSALPKYTHIPNKKLRTQLVREAAHGAALRGLVQDAEMLLAEDAGRLEAEGALERTWRVGQGEIVRAAGMEAAQGRREWVLDGGPYRARYTRNGRHLAIAGKQGHVATFDWQTGTLHSELQLQETCRDITFLHDQSHFAVAQKKYVFIYDRDGVELHRLKSHIEPTRLEFLPYHWLLVSVGNPGTLTYQDTSTGQLIAQHRTKLGACSTLAQNPHTAVIHLGHQNGTLTLWTPNLPTPAVRLLAHSGPVVSASVDPSTGGRYVATAGRDGMVKVWDCRNWRGAVRAWATRGGGAEVEWSQRGALAVASGGSVNVYTKPAIHTPFAPALPPPLYLTHPLPHRPLAALRFCPFQDVLTVGHAAGLSAVLVPGAGEPNFDSAEADPFEGRRTRREREVRGLLDKIQPDAITLDPTTVGGLAPARALTTAVDDAHDTPFARLPRLERLRAAGRADEREEAQADRGGDGDGDGDAANEDAEDEKRKLNRAEKEKEKEKRKMRGKNKSLKRFLRKQRKNVVDPKAVAVRERLQKQRAAREKARAAAKAGEGEGEGEGGRKPSALDRFRRG